MNAYSGFGQSKFGTLYEYSAVGLFDYFFVFRFIGQEENNRARWSAGDEIDMFFLNFKAPAKVYQDNAAFVLLGAAQLAVSGAVLLTSAFLM